MPYGGEDHRHSGHYPGGPAGDSGARRPFRVFPARRRRRLRQARRDQAAVPRRHPRAHLRGLPAGRGRRRGRAGELPRPHDVPGVVEDAPRRAHVRPRAARRRRRRRRGPRNGRAVVRRAGTGGRGGSARRRHAFEVPDALAVDDHLQRVPVDAPSPVPAQLPRDPGPDRPAGVRFSRRALIRIRRLRVVDLSDTWLFPSDRRRPRVRGPAKRSQDEEEQRERPHGA
ncbi:MAG: hypothetical protein BJ554DRAFT_6817 [Olpidium bornovanus]|uniref:Uncharacterized protein n=1 Tax=Olpidium bornovanus TaxID=278681 RepID=A0A8H8A1P7_9FUNG|nr:MAG: hypothetical protein BJ554DRAFT_6817 [Olpidium bornovanus]